MVPARALTDMMGGMGQGPLRDPRLVEIESKLNAGLFDEAQRLLSAIGDVPDAESVRTYFATRILFQRGRLDQAGVVERLRELLARTSDFPEARRMLEAAEAGVLDPAPDVFRRVTGAPASPPPLAPKVELTPRIATQQNIPRAPLVPRFTPRTGTPSYVPATPLPPNPMLAPVRRTLLGTGPEPLGEALPRGELATPVIERPKAAVPRIPSLEVPSVTTLSTLPPPEEAPAKQASTVPAVESTPSPTLERTRGPSLFEVASALDSGYPGRALELAQRAGPDAGPEYALLMARALGSLGETERALAQLERLTRAPLLEPLVRASLARALLEFGRTEQALEQARRALLEDPTDPITRVTTAWALVRMHRRTGNAAFSEEAQPLLEDAHGARGAMSALALALRASLAAESPDLERALRLAKSAVAQDSRAPDAFAALALTAARLGQQAEAQKAQQRLLELSSFEAHASERALERHRLELERGPRAKVADRAQSVALWGEAEAALLHADAEPAARALAAACAEPVRALARRGGSEIWQTLARTAARILTELPVLRHFAPYDCSIFSVERLEVALSLIYASTEQRSANDNVVLLLGAYVGESWRQALGGEWQGVPAFPLSASVEGIGLSQRPCERVRGRIERAESLATETPHALHPGADPLGNSVPLSLIPPAPWDPEAWPSLDKIREIGQNLSQSIVGCYCERALKLPLDLSISGAIAIDRYIALLAPSKAPPDPDAAWARRTALIVGAYLGEVLVQSVDASWEMNGPASGYDSYRLALARGTVATPVSRVIERLAGRRVSPLSDYLARLASGRASVSA